METIIFWVIWALVGAIMLAYYAHTRKPFRNALIGMTTGGLGLLGVHFFGETLGIGLALNLLNTMVSLVLGLPGVVMLVIFNKVL